jgi:type II secretory pathway pseudopilin PulG
MLNSQKGQSLLELIVVIAVAVIVIGALVFATFSSLRNSQFAKNQSQATKLAQEGIEQVRTFRDRDGSVIFTYAPDTKTSKFSDLWSHNLNTECSNQCYFNFDKNFDGQITSIKERGGGQLENLGNGLTREIQITDKSGSCPVTGVSPSPYCYKVEKHVMVKVFWTDFSGMHESKLTTILRNLNP